MAAKIAATGADPNSGGDGDKIILSLEFYYDLDPTVADLTVYDPPAPGGPGGPGGLSLFGVIGTGPASHGRLTFHRPASPPPSSLRWPRAAST